MLSLIPDRLTSSIRLNRRTGAPAAWSPQRNLIRCLIAILCATACCRMAAGQAEANPSAPIGSRVSDPGAVDVAVQMHRSPRIVQTVDPDQRQSLGRVLLSADDAADSGMEGSYLLLLRPGDSQQLQSLLQAQQNPASVEYHHWLTPSAFAARFGLVDSDLAAVVGWVQSQGLTVKRISAGRTVVEFSGPAALIESAFGVHRLAGNSQSTAGGPVSAELSIPAALAPVVSGLLVPGSLALHVAVQHGPTLVLDQKGRGAHPDAAALQVHPLYTTSSTAGNFLALGPADAAALYDLPNAALNPAWTGATLDGSGATIAIAATSNIDLTQVANYRALFGLAANPPTVVLDGAADPGITSQAVQAYLDTEIAGGMAPGARILLYTAADTNTDSGLNLALVRAVDDNLADVLVVSASTCEAMLGAAGNVFYSTLWKQAAAQGISVVVAAGDSGSAGCDDPALVTAASSGLAVNGLASTPYDLAVGGTDFAVLAGPDGGGADFGNYVSTNNASGSRLSVLGYIPEVPWNESSTAYPPTTLAQNLALPAPYASILAGGGGSSTCATAAATISCGGGYPKPYWQSAPGVPSDGVRDLPDLAFFASTGFDFAAWGICTDQDTDASGNPVTDCQPDANGQFHLMSAGGTSAAAAAAAAVLALVRQSTGTRLGQPASVLYALARTHPAVFHDVTTGNNAVACMGGTPDCQANAMGANFLSGSNAALGWDAASGLGSVDAAALVAAWSSVPLASTTTQLMVTPASIEHGQTVSVTVAVTAGASIPTNPATPTGSVALHADNANPIFTPQGVAVGVYPLVANGSTGVLTLNQLPGGSYPLVASYSGAATLAGSFSSPVTVSVTPESSTTLLTWTVTDPATGATTRNAAVPYGSLVQFFAEPYGNRSPMVNGVLQPDGAATGTMAFAFGSMPLGTQPLGIAGTAATTPELLPAGTGTVSALYSGDASFDPSSAATPITVVPAATTLSLSSSSTTYTGAPVTFTIALASDSLGVAPTGTVTLRNGTTTLGSVALSGVAATSTELASGSASIVLSSPPPGTNTLTAVYSGDGNYAGSASPGLVFHGLANFSLTAPAVTLNSIHATASDTLTLTSLSGYVGTVQLSCKLVGATTVPNPPQCGLDPATETLAANGTAQPLLLIYGAGVKLPSGVTAGGMALPLLALLGGLLPLLRLPRRVFSSRVQARLVLLLLLMGAAASSLTACGGSSSLITAGSYNVQVTATDSQNAAITTSVTVAVTVE